jgi:ElaB/YqjD/DUF883 family membrane-anchored ribosome-binding protein
VEPAFQANVVPATPRSNHHCGGASRFAKEATMNSMTDHPTYTSAPPTSLADTASGDGDAASLRAELDALKAQFSTFIAKAGSDAVRTAQDAVKSAGQATADVAGNVANKASDLASAATQQAKTFASELERIGRDNPLGTIAGALLVGVVIGLIGRRH